MVGRGAVQRGISVLMVDGPGQGASLRRQGILTWYEYEIRVGRCIDYLQTRPGNSPRARIYRSLRRPLGSEFDAR